MSDRPDGSPTAVDVVLRPEWAAEIGTDKDLYAVGAGLPPGTPWGVAYTPPAGTDYIITDLSGGLIADAVADADLNQICLVYIQVGAAVPVVAGGNGGAVVPLRKPITVPAGVVVTIFVLNASGHICTGYVTAHGYEVDA